MNLGNTLRLVALTFVSFHVTGHSRDLKDIQFISGPVQAYVLVSFISLPTEDEYPLYYQKSDATKGTLTLSFLETETSFPLGRHLVEGEASGLEEIQLKKITSPGGKTFLGLDLKLKQLSAGEAVVQPVPKGTFKIMIGSVSKKKISWTLSKALKRREAYLSKKAEAPTPTELQPVTSTVTQPESQTLPVKPTVTKSELQPLPVKPTVTKSEYQSLPVKPTVTQVEPPDAVKSAHAEGERLEALHAKKGLSSSRIFSVVPGSKTMIVTMDSVDLKSESGSKGHSLKKLQLGAKVERLEAKAGWMRIVDGGDTGYVRVTSAIYEDEVTPAQEKSLQSQLESKKAKLAAAEVKLAAVEAKRMAKLAALEAKRVAGEAKLAAKAEETRKKMEAASAVSNLKQQQPAVPLEVGVVAQKGATKDVEKKTSPAEISPPKEKQASSQGNALGVAPKLAIADNPELAEKLAREKKAAEDEKMRIEPEENRITYNSYGRRDPFIPVEQGAADNGIDIDQMKVVGIIWQASEPMAVLEHTKEANVSFTVKQGDPVHNGRVSRITREAVTFEISEYGISRSYSLKLVSSKEGTKK